MTDCVQQYAGGVLSNKKLVNSLTLHKHLRNLVETPVQSSVWRENQLFSFCPMLTTTDSHTFLKS